MHTSAITHQMSLEHSQSQHSTPHCLSTGPVCLGKKGSILTQINEKIDARRIDHNTTMVGVLFCFPMRPLRKGYKWTMTQKAKNSFPNRGPHEPYPLFMASETPATTPTMFKIMRVVGGIRRVVHLNRYSSPNSVSSAAFAVTVKFVSTPARTLSRPWNTAKRWAETPPITQNCSFLHRASIVTPLHRSSSTLVRMMEIKRAINQTLARFVSCTQDKKQAHIQNMYCKWKH